MIDFVYFQDGTIGEEAIKKNDVDTLCPVWPLEKTLRRLEKLAGEMVLADELGGDFVAVVNAVDYLRGNRRDSKGKIIDSPKKQIVINSTGDPMGDIQTLRERITAGDMPSSHELAAILGYILELAGDDAA